LAESGLIPAFKSVKTWQLSARNRIIAGLRQRACKAVFRPFHTIKTGGTHHIKTALTSDVKEIALHG
jgi:ABC-type siderophore export system fused ATPase/permease subunit